MSTRSIREDASLYFLPFLLGDNLQAHKLSTKIFFKYGITSTILSEKRSLLDAVDMSSRFVDLSPTQSTSLLCEQLIALVEHDPHFLPILVPCSKEYAEALNEQRETLENFFVISSIDEIFSSSPLTTIP